eukprot:m.33270 g.33270  ORF g.33270 m.33270 type:complete len:349 (+) comp9458_c0_seq2:544-1590(+)
MIPGTMAAATSVSARPEKRQRAQAEDVVRGATKVTRAQGATNVKYVSTLGASLSERDCLSLSLTNLHWLCDLRLTGGVLPSEVQASAAKAESPAAPSSAARPEHSYAELISLAMQANPKKALTLNEIYNFVMDRFPYYRSVEPSWKNSIRYNLSQNKLFTRLPTDGDKAAMWTLTSRLSSPAAATKGRKGPARKAHHQQHQQQQQQAKLAICEAAGDDWEDIEDVTPLAPGLADPIDSDEAWLEALAADAAGAAVADIGVVQHPWADDKAVGEPALLVRGSSVADANFAASLASCLSIFPLSSSALAAESVNGGATGGWDLAINAGEAGRLLDVADHLDDAPIPRDWM